MMVTAFRAICVKSRTKAFWKGFVRLSRKSKQQTARLKSPILKKWPARQTHFAFGSETIALG